MEIETETETETETTSERMNWQNEGRAEKTDLLLEIIYRGVVMTSCTTARRHDCTTARLHDWATERLGVEEMD